MRSLNERFDDVHLQIRRYTFAELNEVVGGSAGERVDDEVIIDWLKRRA